MTTILLVLGAGESPVIELATEVKTVLLLVLLGASLTFGVTMVLPIGGADMPVVISLLNSFTGTAAAMSGFVLGSPLLIIAGALVGAAGGILTKLMADAMNRSLLNIMVGGFGGAEGTQADPAASGGTVRSGRRRRCRHPAGLRPERHRRARLRAGGGPGTARRAASWATCSRTAAST